MAKGPRKLGVSFGTATLTHYGGVYLLHRFLSRIGLRHALARELRVVQRNNRYGAGEMLLALLYPMFLGLERIEMTSLLRQNGVFQYLTGLPSYPNATTLRRFLLRAAPTVLPKLRALHDRFLYRMVLLPEPPSRVIFDVDSTVLVVYGRQQQARIGYNPISAADLPTIRCSVSRASAETFGMGSCDPATPIPPAARWTFSKPASPRFLRA